MDVGRMLKVELAVQRKKKVMKLRYKVAEAGDWLWSLQMGTEIHYHFFLGEVKTFEVGEKNHVLINKSETGTKRLTGHKFKPMSGPRCLAQSSQSLSYGHSVPLFVHCLRLIDSCLIRAV